jgi:hypothetical protein
VIFPPLRRHRRTHEAQADGQPAPSFSDEDLEAEENEFGSMDGSSPENNPYLPPMMDMPGLNNPNGSGGGGGVSGMHHHHLHMQGGLQHMDFSHIQPQLLQQQT